MDAVHHQRLGKRDLGRHAYEERMPERIAALLEHESESNSLRHVIPNLARLSKHDRDVRVAWLCTGRAVQVYKLPDEGAHFCGYRNIQMLCLAIGSHSDMAGDKPVSRTQATSEMQSKFTIPQLQDMIEKAWTMDFNPHGRALTGGIKGTRKHIGTSEAEALCLSLDIPCSGNSFQGKFAWRDLLDFVENYFASSDGDRAGTGVHCTAHPPIFLQRPKHSMTIVGIETLQSGKRQLLTFDPAWAPPSAMRGELADADCTGFAAMWLRRQYRKSEYYLKRFSAFETLTVNLEITS